MKDCSRYHEMISCLVDGQLSEIEKRELDEHIAHCEGCRSLMEIYSTVFTEEPAEPPAELVSGSMLKIRAAAVKKKGIVRRRVMRYIAAAASFAIIIFSVPTLSNLKSMTETSEATETAQISEAPVTATVSGGCNGNYDPSAYMENDYIASVEIDGDLPELLEDYAKTDNGDGSYSIEIRAYMLAYLDSEGYAPDYNEGSESEWALVNYKPTAA